jgi:hypothetical protein
MLEIFLISLALVIGGILKIGIWIGARQATTAIIAGFEFQVSDWKELVDQKNELEKLKERQSYFLSIFESNNLNSISRQMNLENIGRQIYTTAYVEGQIAKSVLEQPREGWVTIEMEKCRLKELAWIANQGFELLVSKYKHFYEHKYQLDKSEAENIDSCIDELERKIAEVPNESSTDKEIRFNRYEKRMKLIWESYPDHDG